MSYLTLDQVADEPTLISSVLTLSTDQSLLMRPLVAQDVDALTDFLTSLSALTRERWVLDSYDKTAAQEMCDAIARYDKLRLVITDQDEKTIGLMEFGLDFVSRTVERFASYGIELTGGSYIQFGPCVRDDSQRKGVFSMAMPKLIDISQRFGKDFMILWGGVLAENIPAIRSYEKFGFYEVGRFNHHIDGYETVDMVLDLRNL